MMYYVVRHPREGVLTIQSTTAVPVFDSKMTPGDENAMRAYSLLDAVRMRRTFCGTPLADHCQILRRGEDSRWSVVRTEQDMRGSHG